jgi:hypothetical protein
MDGIYHDVYVHIVVGRKSLIVVENGFSLFSSHLLLLDELRNFGAYGLEITQSGLKDISRSSGAPEHFMHESFKGYQVALGVTGRVVGPARMGRERTGTRFGWWSSGRRYRGRKLCISGMERGGCGRVDEWGQIDRDGSGWRQEDGRDVLRVPNFT